MGEMERTLCCSVSPDRHLILIVCQMLNVAHANLRDFPEQLSSLQNLRYLEATCNKFPTVPVSILSSLTALTKISLSIQHPEGHGTFKVSSSLLPMLHLGLVELNLIQRNVQWDPLSLFHLGCAVAEVAERTPVPRLRFAI